MTPIDPNSHPARAADVHLQLDKATGEPVLVSAEGELDLNDTAHAILNLCNGATSVDGIVAALASEYEVEENVLRADALECLGDLLERHLIVLQ
jgi:pyrroloquinoline quinone biosynthesis protein D